MSEIAARGHAADHQEHHEALQHHFTSLEQQREAAALGMWVFIAQEVLFFGGLFATYTVYRMLYPDAFSAVTRSLSLVTPSSQGPSPSSKMPSLHSPSVQKRGSALSGRKR